MYFLVLFSFLISFQSIISQSQSIKLYTLYTPSHEVMYRDWFLPTITSYDDFELIVEPCQQTCSSARYYEEGWTKTTITKVKLILSAIKENWGGWFVYSDVDIQFFAPIKNYLGKRIEDADIVIQRGSRGGWGLACTGFFACRANKKTEKIWQKVLAMMQQDTTISDQQCFNICLSDPEFVNLKFECLPNSFFSPGIVRDTPWNKDGEGLIIPELVRMHHANFAVGVDDKLEQLKYVKHAIERRRFKRALPHFVHKINQYVKPHDIVFEYGCSDGNLLNTISCSRRYGWDEDVCFRFLAEDKGVRVFNTIDEIPIDAFTTVISNFELYSVLDKEKTVFQLHKILRTRGLLICIEPSEFTHIWDAIVLGSKCFHEIIRKEVYYKRGNAMVSATMFVAKKL